MLRRRAEHASVYSEGTLTLFLSAVMNYAYILFFLVGQITTSSVLLATFTQRALNCECLNTCSF